MMKQLRRELQSMLACVPCSRPPTLRRCRNENALLATNLPYIAASEDVSRFAEACRACGWTVAEENGWLLLDHPIPPPDAAIPTALLGEVGCLISLLLRHPQDNAPCRDEIRALVKACEESPAAVRRLCGTLHGEWAHRLRKHELLPGALLPYLCAAHTIEKEEHP